MYLVTDLLQYYRRLYIHNHFILEVGKIFFSSFLIYKSEKKNIFDNLERKLKLLINALFQRNGNKFKTNLKRNLSIDLTM